MKRILSFILSAIICFVLASCGYSEADLTKARESGYEEGFADGQADAMERIGSGDVTVVHESDVDPEAEREAGYEDGYADGWAECLEEHGLPAEP